MQGDTNSPLLFNIFVNKITQIFDASCDPVSVNNTPQSCLLCSDDLLLLSTSKDGLQKAIDKMASFYSTLGLIVSLTKTKVMIFNKSGKVLKRYTFLMNGNVFDITSEYQ